MLTPEEKKILLGLINGVEIKGNRQNIAAMMEKLDSLARKVEALPTEEPKPEPKTKKKS